MPTTWKALLVACIAWATIAAAPPARKPEKVSPALNARAAATAPGERIRAWVFFTDKGEAIDAKLADVRARLTPRARARRLRNRGADNLVDRYDIPVRADYVSAVERRGARIRHASRWLNAVSVEVEARRISDVAALDFVRRLDVVHSSRAPIPVPEADPAPPVPPRAPSAPTAIDYGASFTQNDLIDVPPLHALGYNGSGVLICMLDTGFNNLGHDAFSVMDILVTRDFVNGDSIVSDQSGQAGNGNHGTYTLSALGGWAPGQLIGPAWGATFALGKTENTDWERHVEEDDWVAGAEWADSLGADIISSSLGYRDGFTNGEPDYLDTDMDGNTAISTIGADIAAGRGILVITSAGNSGFVAAPSNTIIAPTDGDSVLSIGAVDAAGVRASFSSVGLSADGRIKPDVAAMGVSVRSASATDPSGYVGVSGTSLSCPLVAGAAALILEVNPSLSNMDVIDALRATASQALSPDRLLGWGVIDADSAAGMVSTAIARRTTPSSVVLRPAYPNPFNPTTTIEYEIPQQARVRLSIYTIRGQLVKSLVDEKRPAGAGASVWNGTDGRGESVASGVYVYRLVVGDAVRSRKVVLVK